MLDALKRIFRKPTAPPSPEPSGAAAVERERAPRSLPRMMNPLQTRISQAQNFDADWVVGVINSAQAGDITPLLALYRDIEATDTTIQSALMTRKLAVVARGFNVVPVQDADATDNEVARKVKAMLDRSPNFVDACTWLLHGSVWPVSVVERKWNMGAFDFDHPEFRQVPLELYDCRLRALRIKDVDETGTPLATTHYPDPNRYLVHRGHMMMAPDNWGGPMRALVFWYLFSTQDREWWARFLERFGAPFLVGYYDKNDEESRLVLEQAFQEATRLFGVVATRETQIEVKESAGKGDAAAAFQSFHDVAKTEKLLLILGQTLSAKTDAQGIGGGATPLQAEVRQDVRLWDAFKLAQTVKAGVIKPWMRLNGIQGPCPEFVCGGLDAATMSMLASMLKAAKDAGLELADESIDVVSRQAGLKFQRAATPAPALSPFGAMPGDPSLAMSLMLAAAGLTPSAVANDIISRDAAAGLARATGEELAGLAQIIAGSSSRAEIARKAGAWFRNYRPARSRELVAEVLEAHAANAIAGSP